LTLAGAVLAPACAAPVARDQEAPAPSLGAGEDRRESNVSDESSSISQRYRTLDEYLAFLESRAAVDGHWYREVRPGVYRLETGNYRGVEVEQRIFTRAELERMFGFSSR
jgi:hypothetical protein